MAAHRIPLQDFRSNFVDRKDPESTRHLKKIKAALIKGYSVINFPEGRHILPTTIEFNFGSFAMYKIKAAVIPIAIDYKVKTDAFVDDDTFIPHFIKCFGKRHTEIK
jgi:1-acyl-sn-glycerol-3-phosphate acyltransferase